jgi:hypothetical protein
MTHTHKQTHHTLGSTSLDEGLAQRKDLYLTTRNTRQTSMPPVRIEPAIATSERPQTHALELAATEIGTILIIPTFLFYEKKKICLVYDNPATKRHKLANAAVIIVIIIAPLEISVLHNALNSVKIIHNVRVCTSVGEEERRPVILMW